MFTPEFISKDSNEFILVANHQLQTASAAELSVKFNLARIAYGLSHLPQEVTKCRLVIDIRGQDVPEEVIAFLSKELSEKCTMEFKS